MPHHHVSGQAHAARPTPAVRLDRSRFALRFGAALALTASAPLLRCSLSEQWGAVLAWPALLLGCALAARACAGRLADLDHGAGWSALTVCAVVPGLNVLVALALVVAAGDPGPNLHGAPVSPARRHTIAAVAVWAVLMGALPLYGQTLMLATWLWMAAPF